jgi:tRNA-2-methylthio-N6-dimethylallyladenosine synthase
MNLYDSQQMFDVLTAAGHEIVLSYENADLIILNTCSIREKAEEKVFSDLGRLKSIEEKSSKKFIIAVTGCIAQLHSKNIIERAPYVNIILGPQDIKHIVSAISNFIKNKAPVLSISSKANQKFSQSFSKNHRINVSEFLTIQEGCNNFCAYCIVPFTRGREFSRNVTDIIAEAKQLIVTGAKEIIILGQNVNSYNGDGPNGTKYNLPQLLYEFANIEGLKRLGYTTSHPKDVNESLAQAHKEISILTPFLHLPVQSGSDKILKLMNRRYSQREYIDCVDMLHSYRSDIAFSSDFIVGFPGETDEDFEETLKLIKKVHFAQAYSFKYNPRPNTPAAKIADQISEDVKSTRLQILQRLLDDQQSEFNKGFIGKSLDVLFTKDGRHNNQFSGRSCYSQAVSVYDDNISIGDITRVKITEVTSHSLIGIIER